MKEERVESVLRDECRKLKLWCIKLVPWSMAGLPDRVILGPDKLVVFVETKKPKNGRVTKLQFYIHDRLRAWGFRVEVAWTPEDARILARTLGAVS